MANRALPIGRPAPATNVSASNVFATAAGTREGLAETALTPSTSAQCGGYGGADRRCQPSPPGARAASGVSIRSCRTSSEQWGSARGWAAVSVYSYGSRAE
jgi:hypothetical protein